MERITCC